jgi:DNA polymerase III delta subunit
MGLATHLLRLGLARAGGARVLEECLPPHQRFLSRRLVQQARGWSEEDLKRALLGLGRVDRLLKSTSLSDELVLEEWLLGLMAREN